jgi:hypothetical protein
MKTATPVISCDLVFSFTDFVPYPTDKEITYAMSVERKCEFIQKMKGT